MIISKDKQNHLQTISVMKYLLEEIEKDCNSDHWKGWMGGGAYKKPTLDRLVEIRRLALKLHHKIRGEY